VACGKEPSS